MGQFFDTISSNMTDNIQKIFVIKYAKFITFIVLIWATTTVFGRVLSL